MAADGVSTSEIARRLGINWRTAARLVAAVGAAELFAGAGGVDARSVGAGAARADRGLRGHQGAAGDGDPARRATATPGRSIWSASGSRSCGRGRSGRRSGRAIGRGRCCRSIGREMPTRPRIAGRERRVYALVFSLPFSGAATAHFSFDMTIESFLEGHVRAFDWLGGVPRECVYDNLQVGGRPARARRRPRGHPLERAVLAAARPLRLPRACRARRETPREKGSVEGAVRLLTRPGSGRRGGSVIWPSSMSSTPAGATGSRCPAATPPAGTSSPSGSRTSASSCGRCRRSPSTPAGRRSSRVPADGYLKFGRCFYRAPGGAHPAARRAALGPRPRLDRTPRPHRRRLRAQLRARALAAGAEDAPRAAAGRRS